MAGEPDLNYCPRCGHELVDRQAFGRLRRACPACDRIVFREHKVAASVLVESEGKVLLVRRRLEPHGGDWSLPGGFVDIDEQPDAAAVRECREESGLVVEITGLLDVIAGDVIAGREHVRGADIVVVYTAAWVGGGLEPSDDVDGAGFFALDELPPLAFRATQVAVARWREGLARVARGQE